MPVLDRRSDLQARSIWGGSIAGAEELARWSYYVPKGPAAAGASGSGVSLEPLARSRYLVWDRSLQPAEVDALRLRFRMPLTGPVELYWNGPGEDFAPQRYLLASPEAADPCSVVFDLTPVPGWRDAVTRLGVRVLPAAERGQELSTIEALRLVPSSRLEDGAIRRVALAGASVPAWVARAGSGIERPLRVPSAARLRVSAAPWLARPGPMRVRIVAVTAGARSVLLERDLRQARAPEQGRWQRMDVDLAPYAGRDIVLRFEADEPATGSFVLWGSPMLVGAAADARPNVVLISLDTVRADHLSLYGYSRPTTPHLAAWSRRWATVFDTAVASAPWTLPSHVSMLSGLDAVHHGVNRHGPVPGDLNLLPQRFAAAGYETFATTAGVLLTPELGFARGFDEFRVRGRMESLPEWDAELGRGVNDTVAWVARHRDERFFLFFHTYEAHAPYQAREPFFGEFGGRREQLNGGSPVWMEEAGFEHWVRPLYNLFSPEEFAGGREYPKRVLSAVDRDLVATLYDSGLAYIDSQMARLLEYMDVTGLLEDTVVVITADHGESLYEHGLVGHSSLYDHDLLVPLVVAAPIDASRGRRVAQQVRSVDIAPTLAELAGLPAESEIDGRSLVPFLRGEPAAPRDARSYALSTTRGVSMRLGARGLKVIAQDTVFDPFRGGLEIYDLRQDPQELHNRAGASTTAVGERLIDEIRPARGSIEIRVRNAGSGLLSGLLGGSSIDNMLTAANLNFSCCRHDPSGVVFEAPAGASYTIRVHDQHGDPLVLSLSLAGRSWSGKLSVADQTSGVRIVWDGRGWALDQGVPVAGAWTGVEIVARDVRASEGSAATDAQVLKALRALGYLR